MRWNRFLVFVFGGLVIAGCTPKGPPYEDLAKERKERLMRHENPPGPVSSESTDARSDGAGH
jgi:hypothetical protein